MTPDFDLIRRMLLAVEDTPDGVAPTQLSVDGYSRAQIGYHAHLLVEEGLATGIDVRNVGDTHPQVLLTDLTLSGHEFAGLARDDFRWAEAMASAQSVGQVTLEALKHLLVGAKRRHPRQPGIGSRARPDPNALVPGKDYPRWMHHATQPPRRVYSAEEEAALGPEWSRKYIYQEYPKVKYHWTREPTTVKNAEEEARLGGGWANTPAAFDPYKGPRPPRTEERDPLKWLDEWSVPGLSSEHRKKIKAQLLRAEATFERSPDPETGALSAMRQAYGGIAGVFLEAGILTEDLLRNDIPQFVWDSAIAGGWWRLASETRQDIFPERVGHYWVWRDDSRDWKGLFRAETGDWQARLLEVPSREIPRVQSKASVSAALASVGQFADEGTKIAPAPVTAEQAQPGSGTAKGSDVKVAKPDSKPNRKGDASLLEGKRLANFQHAEAYLGITDRQRQHLIKLGRLRVEGEGSNRKITTESLLKYLPPENPK